MTLACSLLGYNTHRVLHREVTWPEQSTVRLKRVESRLSRIDLPTEYACVLDTVKEEICCGREREADAVNSLERPRY